MIVAMGKRRARGQGKVRLPEERKSDLASVLPQSMAEIIEIGMLRSAGGGHGFPARGQARRGFSLTADGAGVDKRQRCAGPRERSANIARRGRRRVCYFL
jgi:hypothetical protein